MPTNKLDMITVTCGVVAGVVAVSLLWWLAPEVLSYVLLLFFTPEPQN